MKIQQRANILTGVVAAAILLLVAIVWIQQKDKNALNTLEKSLLNLHGYIADLEHKEILYRTEKDTASLTTLFRLDSEIDSVINSFPKKLKKKSEVGTFQEKKKRYLSQVMTLDTLIREYGLHKNDGLRDSLRSSVHAVESDLKDLQNTLLTKQMLLLRRREKDFIIRSDLSYQEKLANDYETFLLLLDDASMSSVQKKKIREGIVTYKSAFDAFVANAQKIGLDGLSGVRNDLAVSYENMVGSLDSLIESFELYVSNRVRTAGVLNLIIVIGVILSLLIYLRNFLQTNIVRDLVRLESTVKRLGEGDLSVKTDIDRNDEIGSLALMLDSLVQQLFESNLDSEQKKLLIEEFHSPVFLVAGNAEILLMNKSANSFFGGKDRTGNSLTSIISSSQPIILMKRDAQKLQLSDGRAVTAYAFPVSNSNDEIRYGVVIEDTTESVTIAQSLGKTIADLSVIVTGLERSAQSVEHHSSEMLNYSSAVSNETSTLAMNLEHGASLLSSNSQRVTHMSTSLQETSMVLGEIKKETEDAQTLTESAVSAVNDISQKSIELSSSVESISAFIDTISEISEQTQLLALNATIEAARAGDAGKGFAVVANEVKDLSMQTSKATEDIKNRVEQVSVSTDTTREAVGIIADVIEKLNSLVVQIASAVVQQSSATSEISEQVTVTAGDITTISDQISQSVQLMNSLASRSTDFTQGTVDLNNNSKQLTESSHSLEAVTSKLNGLIADLKK